MQDVNGLLERLKKAKEAFAKIIDEVAVLISEVTLPTNNTDDVQQTTQKVHSAEQKIILYNAMAVHFKKLYPKTKAAPTTALAKLNPKILRGLEYAVKQKYTEKQMTDMLDHWFKVFNDSSQSSLRDYGITFSNYFDKSKMDTRVETADARQSNYDKPSKNFEAVE